MILPVDMLILGWLTLGRPRLELFTRPGPQMGTVRKGKASLLLGEFYTIGADVCAKPQTTRVTVYITTCVYYIPAYIHPFHPSIHTYTFTYTYTYTYYIHIHITYAHIMVYMWLHMYSWIYVVGWPDVRSIRSSSLTSCEGLSHRMVALNHSLHG